MKNVWDIMYDIMAAAIYIAAVTILLNVSVLLKQMNMNVGKAVYDTATVQQGEPEQEGKDTITYDELCSVISGKLEYDIVVTVSDTEREITRKGHIENTYDMEDIPKAEQYQRRYQYDEEGNIKKIVYEGI